MNTTHLHEVYISTNVYWITFGQEILFLIQDNFGTHILNNIKSFYFDKVVVTCLTLRTFERGDK